MGREKKRLQRRKRRLWEQDPRCHWCGQVTQLIEHYVRHPPRNMATLDHLRSRLDPSRGSDAEESTVLACKECNERRAAEEVRALPIEDLHKRSGRYPKS